MKGRKLKIEFEKKWNTEYKDAKNILRYLKTYPDILSQLKLQNLHDEVSIDFAQEEWLRLQSKFTHPNETEFFNQYYIPIQKNSFDYFMDISSEMYPIFEIHFFFYEPYKWYKKFVTEDIKSLLLAHDERVDLESLQKDNNIKRWDKVSEFFVERLNLALEGKIEMRKVTIGQIESHSETDIGLERHDETNSIIISGVTPISFGLLPPLTSINVIEIINDNPDRQFTDLHRIKNIQDLIHVFWHIGFRNDTRCFFEFADFEGNAVYENDALSITCGKREIYNSIPKELSRLQNEKEEEI